MYLQIHWYGSQPHIQCHMPCTEPCSSIRAYTPYTLHSVEQNCLLLFFFFFQLKFNLVNGRTNYIPTYYGFSFGFSLCALRIYHMCCAQAMLLRLYQCKYVCMPLKEAMDVMFGVEMEFIMLDCMLDCMQCRQAGRHSYFIYALLLFWIINTNTD